MEILRRTLNSRWSAFLILIPVTGGAGGPGAPTHPALVQLGGGAHYQVAAHSLKEFTIHECSLNIDTILTLQITLNIDTISGYTLT